MNHRTSPARRTVAVRKNLSDAPSSPRMDESLSKHAPNNNSSNNNNNNKILVAEENRHSQKDHLYYSNEYHYLENDDNDSYCCSKHQKYMDYRYDRNTFLIGMAILVIYVLVGLLREVAILDAPVTSRLAKSPNYWRRANSNSGIRTIHRPTSKPIPEEHRDSSQHQLPASAAAAAATSIDRGNRRKQSPRSGHLDLQSRNGTLVTLVHIGKTGGSALRDLIDYATGYCKINYYHDNTIPLAEGSLFRDAHKHERTTLQTHMCALARVTSSSSSGGGGGLVHLDRNLPRTLTDSHFLVPLRNPVQRLVSWFYYEKHFQTVKQTRYSRALHDLIDPSRCAFETANELFLGKRIATTKHRHHRRNQSSSQQQQQQQQQQQLPAGVVEATPEYCYKLSRACLSGDIPCYGHNFFNYEYYLEDILVRVLQGVAAIKETKKIMTDNAQQHDGTAAAAFTATPATALQGNYHPPPPTQSSSSAIANMPRVDVIRAEHSWDDLNRTLQSWTGLPMTPDMDFFYLLRKPFDVDTDHESALDLSPEAMKSVCELLCPELLAYTKILKYAANLSPSQKQASVSDLAATCGGSEVFSIDAVCGNSFRYQNARESKQSKLCEPRRSPEQVQRGRRRLSYLRDHPGLPPC